jgi:hypothetical protein
MDARATVNGEDRISAEMSTAESLFFIVCVSGGEMRKLKGAGSWFEGRAFELTTGPV